MHNGGTVRYCSYLRTHLLRQKVNTPAPKNIMSRKQIDVVVTAACLLPAISL
jgi:hypothetical protein